MMDTKDRDGNSIVVGSHVQVLSVPALDFEPDEAERVQSMLGDVLEVYEIDLYGQAWVEKWWHLDSGESTSHSLALRSDEMVLSKPKAGS
ncbi:hypothetical protein [Solimonas sp. K1W22B-7]|uniref:hypothetical protein n=1 Tax=Solimonas sp. K1W22B-7 TaxID=2303331 RepID=UPI0013C4BE0A|nr:hypothetical protein [Solimonas sp. K1W22B-7]